MRMLRDLPMRRMARVPIAMKKMAAGSAEVEVQRVAACWPIQAAIGSLSEPILAAVSLSLMLFLPLCDVSCVDLRCSLSEELKVYGQESQKWNRRMAAAKSANRRHLRVSAPVRTGACIDSSTLDIRHRYSSSLA